MWNHFRQYPLFALIMMIGSIAMLVPALHAAKIGEWRVMQVFLDFFLLNLVLAIILGIAMMNRKVQNTARSHLITVLLTYTILPIFLAMPFVTLIPAIGPAQGYFEMLSSLTTTGATLINIPESIADPLHLWRAIVAWLGGFFVLVIAFGIMEPMNLGGFEIRSLVSGTSGANREGMDASERILKHVKTIGPIYTFATFVLAILLMMSGDRALVAMIHAMSVLSTSGISPESVVLDTASGRVGELFIALFMLLAISHRGFLMFSGRIKMGWIKRDVEVRMMLIAISAVILVLFARHWLAALDISRQEDLTGAMRALWGGVFTALSFLTTTGFESSDWQSARNWSGMDSPGIVLLALAVLGGGVATTAGGVKLLRMYALYKHGMREMERLVHPSSVGGAGLAARRFRREGAFIAWIFLMLFLVAISTFMLILTFLGVSFDNSIALSMAALTNTGPAATLLDPSFRYSDLSDFARYVLCVAMIFGRVEILAMVALLNPSFWRR